MPEGHTLHRLASSLDHAFTGTRPLVTSPQGKFASGAALLSGREVLESTSWGKHLFVGFDPDAWLHVHLGLIGKMSVTAYEEDVPEVVGQVRLRILTQPGEQPAYVADLRGATLCEVTTPEAMDSVIARLGPDPLRASADPERAWERLSRSGRPIAELLMDQAVLAGVGNVYRSELLFRHRVTPFVPGNKVRRRTWEAMWADLVELMHIGVVYGQILTMDDQVADAREVIGLGISPAVLERRFWVYRRAGEQCRVCRSRVRTMVLAGRNLFWCGRCQRRH